MKKFIWIGIFLIFIVVLGGVFIAIYLFNLEDKDLQNVKPDLEVSANDLLNAFEVNEAAADSIYLNKIIDVSGTVVSVNFAENNAVNVSLKTENPLSTVICTFNSTPDKFEIKPDDKVTIRGELTGFLMDVLLNNCVIVKDP